MTDPLLFIIVVGLLALAVGVDVAVVVARLRRRWR
jgi:hypothetical protein